MTDAEIQAICTAITQLKDISNGYASRELCEPVDVTIKRLRSLPGIEEVYED